MAGEISEIILDYMFPMLKGSKGCSLSHELKISPDYEAGYHKADLLSHEGKINVDISLEKDRLHNRILADFLDGFLIKCLELGNIKAFDYLIDHVQAPDNIILYILFNPGVFSLIINNVWMYIINPNMKSGYAGHLIDHVFSSGSHKAVIGLYKHSNDYWSPDPNLLLQRADRCLFSKVIKILSDDEKMQLIRTISSNPEYTRDEQFWLISHVTGSLFGSGIGKEFIQRALESRSK